MSSAMITNAFSVTIEETQIGFPQRLNFALWWQAYYLRLPLCILVTRFVTMQVMVAVFRIDKFSR
jgi:hypothetical protein